MKTKSTPFLAAALLSLATLGIPVANTFAQGTAFTYQGQLYNGASLANGLYDLRFHLYSASSGGTLIDGPITNAPVTVSNGLFVVTLNFTGAGDFNGQTLWLQIGARSNGQAVAYTTLSPRQQLTPTPYSIFAEGANAAGLTGTVPASDLSGVNGSGLIDLNAAQLLTGTVPPAALPPDVALLDAPAQSFTGINTFSGTGESFIINSGPIITTLYTGLGLQYYPSSGEGAIMSSYNDGFGYLSFYTKQGGGFPILKQVQIGRYGDVKIDQQNSNGGLIDNGTTNGVGLTFGLNSGEGIASQRVASTNGSNQYGLDFYTDFAKRMSIAQSGFVGIGRQTPVTGADFFDVDSPAASGAYGGMYIDTVGTGTLPFYGYAMNGSALAWTYLDGSDGNKWKLYNSGNWLTVTPAGNVGINTTAPSTSDSLEVNGSVRMDNNPIYLRASGDQNHGIAYMQTLEGIFFDGPYVFGYNGGALGTSNPDTITLKWYYDGTVWISNNCSVASLTIRGGADLAEPFNFTADRGEVPEGAVVVIDDENPGHLKLSDSPYDTHVAGVISGANGVHPGIQMQQQGMIEGGKNVALSGRVYVQADTLNGPIKPGDLLTTSSSPGHAMKVTDHARAAGAILGKAMTGLSEGQGMVLVLVTLQ